ncbi:MAG TPA: hypothetical protein VD948_06520, partial [Rhodothermales bacterium]|nr:hypothetical protein [Rhodothermales bacterium]
TGEQIHAFGCQLAGLSFELPFGQSGLPTITFTYNVAYWRRLTRSFPDATALASDATAPIAGGSVVLTDSGSTARTLVNPARMAINIELGLQPIPSSSTNGTYQQIGGWARTDFQATLEMDLPWVDTYETWWDTANQSITAKALIATLNPIAGLSVGFFCPRLLPMGQRPSVPTNVNDQTYVTVRFLCDEGPDPTSDLTKSSIRFFAG